MLRPVAVLKLLEALIVALHGAVVLAGKGRTSHKEKISALLAAGRCELRPTLVQVTTGRRDRKETRLVP